MWKIKEMEKKMVSIKHNKHNAISTNSDTRETATNPLIENDSRI